MNTMKNNLVVNKLIKETLENRTHWETIETQNLESNHPIFSGKINFSNIYTYRSYIQLHNNNLKGRFYLLTYRNPLTFNSLKYIEELVLIYELDGKLKTLQPNDTYLLNALRRAIEEKISKDEIDIELDQFLKS